MPETPALDLTHWTVEEIVDRIAAREVSATEVLEAFLTRTAGLEDRVGAYLRRHDDAARRRAAEIDRRLAAGEPVGPLAGVPIALKDNLHLEGWPVTAGSKVLAGYVAPYTATAVARLLEAGVVPTGQTNCDEFAMGSSCENSAYRLTHNPWSLDRVPGGSSGGSAAAVAAGMVPLALGSDTGGSIRQPAAFCGLVGIKPTWGRVSRFGLVAFTSSTDQIGPLARTVRDAALALGLMAGGDDRDSTCPPEAVPDYLEGIEDGMSRRGRPLRVGLVKEIDLAGLAPDVASDFRAAIARFERLGAEIVEVSVSTLTAAVAAYYVIATSEASSNLARFDGVRYGRRAPAKTLESLYALSRSEGFGPEVKRRIVLGTFALSAGYYDAYYGRARGVVETMRRELAAALTEVDVLATPTSPTAAFRIGELVEDPLSMYLSDVFTTPASLVGLPAVSLPSGRDERGLPLGLQLIGKPWDEATVLAAARAFERDLGWRIEPGFSAGVG